MKIRSGFVTNSSSSSYIVISNTGAELYKDWFKDKYIVLGNCGESEFGWQHEEYNDVYSKMNFAFLQALAVDNSNWQSMLDEVIKEHTGAYSIKWILTDDWQAKDGMIHGYIDHQSCASEGENTEMFNSKEDLHNFLFYTGSYIQCGNDNG